MRIKLDKKIKWDKLSKDEIKKQFKFQKALKSKQIRVRRIRVKIHKNRN
jgi:hypothetical protein